MSLTATYNGDISRVQLSATALGASATYAVVDRSLNESLWFTVRGGTQLPVETETAELDDFEFFADTLNHYRITSYDASDVQQAQFTTDITPSLAGQVWLKSLRYPALNMALYRVIDRGQDIDRPARGGAWPVVGRSVPVATIDQRDSQRFTLHVQTEDADAAGVLDLTLVAGGIFFIHVPPEVGDKVPGGYVRIGETSQHRRTTQQRWEFALPCTVVAPPKPQIVGSLLVAETVFRLYGDANALWAAHSTGRSLLSTFLTLDDVVVT